MSSGACHSLFFLNENPASFKIWLVVPLLRVSSKNSATDSWIFFFASTAVLQHDEISSCGAYETYILPSCHISVLNFIRLIFIVFFYCILYYTHIRICLSMLC